MTGQSERIREAHRGARRAEPASRSRLSALATFGLSFVQVDDFNVIVEGEYELNLAMSFWRSVDGSAQGYLVSGLAAEIGRTKIIKPIAIGQTNPAPDRDSDATGDRTAESTTASAVAIAGSGAGATSRLLPVVAP